LVESGRLIVRRRRSRKRRGGRKAAHRPQGRAGPIGRCAAV